MDKAFSDISIHLLLFMSLAHFIHHLLLYAFPAMLILITHDIELTYLEMGILGSTPTLIMALTSPLIGYLGKNIRTGFNIVLIGLFLFSMSSLVIFFSENFIHLLIGNFFLGLGCTTYHPIGLGVSANSFSGDKRGKAMAINHAAGVVGTAASPVSTLGLAVLLLDWRHTFLSIALLCLGILIIMYLWSHTKSLVVKYQKILEKFETKKLNLSNSKSFELNDENFDIQIKKWIIISLVIILAISALRSGVYRLISYFTVTLLRDFYSVGSFEAGILTSFILLLGSGMDVYGAYISDKSGAYGRIKIVLLSAIGTSIAILVIMFITAYITTNIQIWGILFGFALFAVCFYLAGGTLQALMSDIVPQEQRTFFYSIVFSLGLVVSSFSPTIFGLLLDIYQSPLVGFIFMLLLISGSFFVAFIFKIRLDFAVRNNLLNP